MEIIEFLQSTQQKNLKNFIGFKVKWGQFTMFYNVQI